ncbi:MAG: PadR family transcriptional regulator [Gemmatimonadales bacterium]
MSTARTDRLPGTLDLLVLRILAREPLHGWAIAQRMQEVSRDVLTVGQGSLYPALYRLEEAGAIEADWQVSEAGRRARVYRLTKEGHRQLERERTSWKEFTAAVGRVLQFA